MAETNKPAIIAYIIHSLVIIGLIPWNAYNTVVLHETNRAQSAVLRDLHNYQARIAKIELAASLIPIDIDFSDRWYRREEVLVQERQRNIDKSQDLMINLLQLYHPPHKETK